ncbi:MAG: hypothetical protein QOI31_1599 [Solirubrobacterales bacterium]|jgi:hypothetical protein|nr:hypothetical protein [Solirubrobacterales bacterium]
MHASPKSTLAIALLLGALFLFACGDEKTTTTTVTETTTVVEPATDTGEETSPPEEGNGEASDLPPCSEGVLPCLNPDGSVSEEPEGGGIDGSGEIADLPLCSEAEPPCRTEDGELVEP